MTPRLVQQSDLKDDLALAGIANSWDALLEIQSQGLSRQPILGEWEDNLYSPFVRQHSASGKRALADSPAQEHVASLLRERFRLRLEIRRLRRLLSERESELAQLEEKPTYVVAVDEVDPDSTAVFGPPTSRRGTHLRIVARRKMIARVNPADFAD